MKTESSTGHASARDFSGEELTESLNAVRRAKTELHNRLRSRLVSRSSRLTSPPPHWHTRQVQQLDKAYELFSQAEAKWELLVVAFGGSYDV